MPNENQIRSMFGQYGLPLSEFDPDLDYDEDIYEQMSLRSLEDPIAHFLQEVVKSFF